MALRSLLSSSNISISLIFIITVTSSSSMAATDSSVSAPVEAAVHIVYTDRPQHEELELYHLRTLSSVLGSDLARPPISRAGLLRPFRDTVMRRPFDAIGAPRFQLDEDAAKGALLYTYKHAACGFSAKLTPKQVEEISKLPGVLQVVESRTMQLHESPAKLTNILM